MDDKAKEHIVIYTLPQAITLVRRLEGSKPLAISNILVAHLFVRDVVPVLGVKVCEIRTVLQ